MTPTERAEINVRASELYAQGLDLDAVIEALVRDGADRQAARHAAKRAELLERMIAAQEIREDIECTE